MLQNNGFAVMIVASTAVAVVTDGRVCQKYCEFFISIMLERWSKNIIEKRYRFRRSDEVIFSDKGIDLGFQMK